MCKGCGKMEHKPKGKAIDKATRKYGEGVHSKSGLKKLGLEKVRKLTKPEKDELNKLRSKNYSGHYELNKGKAIEGAMDKHSKIVKKDTILPGYKRKKHDILHIRDDRGVIVSYNPKNYMKPSEEKAKIEFNISKIHRAPSLMRELKKEKRDKLRGK